MTKQIVAFDEKLLFVQAAKLWNSFDSFRLRINEFYKQTDLFHLKLIQKKKLIKLFNFLCAFFCLDGTSMKRFQSLVCLKEKCLLKIFRTKVVLAHFFFLKKKGINFKKINIQRAFFSFFLPSSILNCRWLNACCLMSFLSPIICSF